MTNTECQNAAAFVIYHWSFVIVHLEFRGGREPEPGVPGFSTDENPFVILRDLAEERVPQGGLLKCFALEAAAEGFGFGLRGRTPGEDGFQRLFRVGSALTLSGLSVVVQRAPITQNTGTIYDEYLRGVRG